MISLRDLRPIEALADRDIDLHIRQDSPLNKLIAPYLSAEVESIEDLVAVMNADVNHEALANELGKELARIMNGQRAYIKNDINAYINDIYEDVMRRLQKVEAFPLPVKVLTRNLPDLFTDGVLEEMIEKHKDKELPTQEWKGKMSAMTDQELMQAFSERFDGDTKDAIDKVITLLPVSMETLYRKHYTNLRVEGYPEGYTLVAGLEIPFSHLESALVYLIAEALDDTELTDSFSITTTEYSKTLSFVRIKAAKQLNGIFNLLEIEEKQNKVFVHIDVDASPATFIMTQGISEDLIERYSHDVVVGLALLSRKGNNIRVDRNDKNKAIISDGLHERAQSAYDAVFAHHELMAKQKQNSNQVIQTTLAFEASINSADFELPESVSKNELLRRVRAQIAVHMNCKSDRILDGIRQVVTLGMYPKSGAASFLNAMDSYADTLSDPREAATMASVDMSAEWLVDQLIL